MKMKKLMTFCFVATMWLSANSQTLKKQGTTAVGVLPDNWTEMSAIGDMNFDGTDDMALIAFPDEDSQQPVLAIYWGNVNGEFTLWKVYDDVFQVFEEENSSPEYLISIAPNGTMRIDFSMWQSAGSWQTGTDSYIFRYQHGDIFLIGQEHDSMMRNTGNGKRVSINYLTHKKQTTLYNISEEKDRSVRWEKIPRHPLKRLSEFKLEY